MNVLKTLAFIVSMCSLSVIYYRRTRVQVQVYVNLRLTVSRPVCLGVGIPSAAHDQIFVFSLTIAGFLMRGTLSDERMGQ
jgi:hypothetical protein